MKLPRDASGQEVVKALKRLGFAITRQRGSHIRMEKGPLHVTVPNHNPVLPKTLQSLLRDANVTLEEFLKEL